ncbi:hypothetical protein EAH87_04430 [Sphingomonas koreensis]|nr:hypothetical protein EAH87_04430 [Sphingomonas koreensis]
MATAFKIDLDTALLAAPAAPALMLIHSDDPYADLERQSDSVGQHGVHPTALLLGAGGYALMLGSFWAMFARDAEATMVLAVITVLMLMYFALLFGGILLADTPAPGTLRSFQSFLSGKVETATGAVEGREALLMIVGLPAVLALMATAIGIIAHLPLA